MVRLHNGHRLVGAIKKGISAVQNAYEQQRKAAEKRAKRNMAAARTKYEKERIKADLEHEKLVLQRKMYEAKAAVKREQAEVTRARLTAGDLTISERLGRAGSDLSRDLGSIYRQLSGGSSKRTMRRRSATTKSRAKARR